MDGIAVFIQYYVPGNLLSHVISYENMERQIKSNLKNDEENDEEIYIELENIYSAYNIVLNDKGAYGGGIFCDIISCLRYNTDEEKANTLYEVYGSGTKAGYISYEEVGSMVNYLINEYGADTFYSLYKNLITLEEAYGKDVDELYEEWGKHITEEYGEILKIDTYNYIVGDK